MADTEGYQLDRGSVRRLDRTVRKVLGSADIVGPAYPPKTAHAETVLGRLTAKVGDEWAWEEVYHKADGTFAAVDGGRAGSNSTTPKFLAFPLVDDPDPDYEADTVVALKRSATKSGDTWEPGWAILTPPPAPEPPPATPAGLIPVALASDSGGAGGPGTWTYTLNDPDTGDPLADADGTTAAATGQSPAWARPTWKANAATHGTARYDADGHLVLWQADETPYTGPCATE
jgi:hypothetical protein